MFPWSDTCLFKRLKKQRHLSEKEQEILNLWKTDVCSGGELPEVEIVSLLEEQIPKYKLRADTLTEFSGYENQDWFIPCPALKPEDADTSLLSPDTIRETLNYFLLCSNRVSQMTKTYNDIEAVTRLLEEKEKDIELTARIGKELLSNNQKLENTVANLESELKTANEKITQLQHELLKKTELIQILTNDVEESASEPETPTGHINFDVLQRRIGKLEEENIQLRNEASFLAEQTDEVEQQEQRLVSDFASQLATTRSDLSSITEEAERLREECRVFKRLSDNLTDKLQTTEQKLSKSKSENEELTALLVVTRDTQNELANELAELKDRYAEVMGLLQETQEALKKHNKKGVPTVRGGGLFSSLQTSSLMSSHHPDSLGTELECSLFSELSLDSGISSDRVPYYKKVFDTVRTASKSSSMGSASPTQQNSYHSQVSYDSASSVVSYEVNKRDRKSYTASSSHRISYLSDDYVMSDSECSDDSAYPGGPKEGIPGAPGSADLAEALRRLTPAAVYARRMALSSGTFGGDAFDLECRTPDSIMSTSSYSGGAFNAHWKLPDKLQIVKPIEGSQTLHHWSQLATPSLGGLLDERPGIKTRGCAELEDLGLHIYSLTDVEEDEEIIHPGKSFQVSGHVYTATNSTVMHLDDGTSLTSSIQGSRMSTVSNSRASTRASTVPGTPLRSRRNSTCTFSVTLGLAKLLNERGITAATPSTLVTPSFTPTATPCNSPEGGSPQSTPSHSRSVSPSVAPFSSAFGLPGFLVSSGAEYLRKTLTGGLVEPVTHMSRSKDLRSDTTVSKLDKKGLTGIRLVETVEKIGLETLISPQSSDSSEIGAIPTNESRKVVTKPGSSRNRHSLSDTKSKSKRSARAMRPDLGTVLGSVPTPPVTKENTPSQSSSTLGTLSSLLFGRKGGLL
ncbi:trafficking kinesin-binding protein milt isoform X2 [Planococcus citri]|uniref:trafficking kinesin-binding protein milt isoform X2 n=1 Tax=Planococcus citri TaxID=170843 RepID=UPI0031F78F50